MVEAYAHDPSIVVIGGGNGAPAVLEGLAATGLAPNTTAGLTVYDNGGSTGKLRAANPELLAPGDVRRALIAFAGDREAATEFNRRREEDGHVVGNLVLAELTEKFGDFDLAVEEVARRLQVTGRVLPVSLKASTLAIDQLGQRIFGEHEIETSLIHDPWATVFLEPPVDVHPELVKAIHGADAVVIAPGSLYASLGAALAPTGMSDALEASRGKLIAVANLQPEHLQTPDGWHVADHVLALESLTRRRFDYVLYHQGGLPDGTPPLDTSPAGFGALSAQAIGIPMARIREKDGRVVHDGIAVAKQIARLLTVHRPEYAPAVY